MMSTVEQVDCILKHFLLPFRMVLNEQTYIKLKVDQMDAGLVLSAPPCGANNTTDALVLCFDADILDV